MSSGWRSWCAAFFVLFALVVTQDADACRRRMTGDGQSCGRACLSWCQTPFNPLGYKATSFHQTCKLCCGWAYVPTLHQMDQTCEGCRESCPQCESLTRCTPAAISTIGAVIPCCAATILGNPYPVIGASVEAGYLGWLYATDDFSHAWRKAKTDSTAQIDALLHDRNTSPDTLSLLGEATSLVDPDQELANSEISTRLVLQPDGTAMPG